MMKMVGVVGGLMDLLPNERLKPSWIVIFDCQVTTYPHLVLISLARSRIKGTEGGVDYGGRSDPIGIGV